MKTFRIEPLGRLVPLKWNRIIIDIFVITLAFLLFIIWYRSYIGITVPASFSNINYYKVYLITTDKKYQYWEFVNQGAADMAAAAGIEYIWDAPEVRNVNKQIDVINNAVENGANALLIAADDPKRISSAVEDAKAKGVKVVYVDSPAFEEAITTLATDNYQAGILAGQTMLSILEKKGIKSGSIGIVSLAAKANSKLREDGFRDILVKDGRYTLLDTVYLVSDKKEITENAIEELIKNNEDLVALYGTNEGTSLGVGYAIQAHDNKYIGVGFDKTEDMVKLLDAGSLKAIINQNPYTMGYLGMAEAIAAIFGKSTGPEFIDTGVSVVE